MLFERRCCQEFGCLPSQLEGESVVELEGLLALADAEKRMKANG